MEHSVKIVPLKTKVPVSQNFFVLDSISCFYPCRLKFGQGLTSVQVIYCRCHKCKTHKNPQGFQPTTQLHPHCHNPCDSLA